LRTSPFFSPRLWESGVRSLEHSDETAVFKKFPEGYPAFVEELPGANTQGETLEQAHGNLVEAVQLVLEANRRLAEESIAGEDVIRGPFAFPAS